MSLQTATSFWRFLKTLRGCDPRWKDAKQLLPVGNVRYYRFCAVEEVQEDLAGVSPAPVDLLGRLLCKTAHDPPHPTTQHKKWAFAVRGRTQVLDSPESICMICMLSPEINGKILCFCFLWPTQKNKRKIKKEYSSVKKLSEVVAHTLMTSWRQERLTSWSPAGGTTAWNVVITHRSGLRISGASPAASIVTSIKPVIAAFLTLNTRFAVCYHHVNHLWDAVWQNPSETPKRHGKSNQ